MELVSTGRGGLHEIKASLVLRWQDLWPTDVDSLKAQPALTPRSSDQQSAGEHVGTLGEEEDTSRYEDRERIVRGITTLELSEGYTASAHGLRADLIEEQ